LTRTVDAGENGGYNGLVVDDMVAPKVLEVHKEADQVRGGSSRWCARSATPGVVSCGG
jgi:hypothetical protein